MSIPPATFRLIGENEPYFLYTNSSLFVNRCLKKRPSYLRHQRYLHERAGEEEGNMLTSINKSV